MRIQLWGLGVKGKSPNLSSQERVNLYSEIYPIEDRSVLALYPTPGLDAFGSLLAGNGYRGWIVNDNVLYAVHSNTLYQIDANGNRTSRGTIGSYAGRVEMACDGTTILIVDGVHGANYDISSATLSFIADADFPDTATTCTWLGYFLVDSGSGQFALSSDGISWDATDFASAETFPDPILRVDSDRGQLILFGSYSTEFWAQTGALDFPFQRISGGAVQWGLAAKWSVARFGSTLIFLGANRLGQAQVVLLDGYQPTPISTPDLDHVINGYTRIDDATAYSYLLGGHMMYQINFPSEDRTWLYDGQSSSWSILKSGGGRHRGEMAISHAGKTRIADYGTGQLYTLNPETFTDNGTMILRELVSKHIFEKNLTVSELRLNMRTGVGITSGQGSDPKIMLRISRDGGNSWGDELVESLGKIGEYSTQVVFRRLGRARDWVFKVRVSDPVFTGFMDAWIEASA